MSDLKYIIFFAFIAISIILSVIGQPDQPPDIYCAPFNTGCEFCVAGSYTCGWCVNGTGSMNFAADCIQGNESGPLDYNCALFLYGSQTVSQCPITAPTNEATFPYGTLEPFGFGPSSPASPLPPPSSPSSSNPTSSNPTSSGQPSSSSPTSSSNPTSSQSPSNSPPGSSPSSSDSSTIKIVSLVVILLLVIGIHLIA